MYNIYIVSIFHGRHLWGLCVPSEAILSGETPVGWTGAAPELFPRGLGCVVGSYNEPVLALVRTHPLGV